jgi:hypothetical protein
VDKIGEGPDQEHPQEYHPQKLEALNQGQDLPIVPPQVEKNDDKQGRRRTQHMEEKSAFLRFQVLESESFGHGFL